MLLIFDKVMTGSRIAPTGPQECFGVHPDLSTFAQVLGGGFPGACFGGRAEVLRLEAENEVMHGGAYTANPLVVAAANAVLAWIERERDTLYPRLFELACRLRDGLVRAIRRPGTRVSTRGWPSSRSSSAAASSTAWATTAAPWPG